MTPEQHNKYLGLVHLVYAALHSLMGVVLGVMMVVMFSTMPASPEGNPPPLTFIIVMACFFLVFSVGWSIPSIVAAYALLKRRRWAKTASIVAGVFAAPQMPIGTAVSVYTFWFAFGEPGRLLYDQPAKSLLALPSEDRAGINQGAEHEYFPPATPPDWR